MSEMLEKCVGAGVEGRQDTIRRTTQALLNNIAPENVATIVQDMAEVELETPSDLQVVVDIIYKDALDEAHYVVFRYSAPE